MTTYNLTSHAGKPTSGRFVYRGWGGKWIWQCDMCGDYQIGIKRWSDAVSHALDHAYLCPHVNAKNRSYQPQL